MSEIPKHSVYNVPTGKIIETKKWYGKKHRISITTDSKEDLIEIRVKTELNWFEQKVDLLLKKFGKHKWVQLKVSIEEKEEVVFLNVNSFAKRTLQDVENIRSNIEKSVKEAADDLKLAKNIADTEKISSHHILLVRAIHKETQQIFKNWPENQEYVQKSIEDPAKKGRLIYYTLLKTSELFVQKKVLGIGAQKIVYLAKNFATGQEVAFIKSRSSQESKEFSEMEDYFLKKFKGSPYIVQQQKAAYIAEYGLIEDAVMIEEFCNGGALSDLSTKLTLSQKKTIARDILKGVQFLHQNKVVHSDLKKGNILIHINPQNPTLVSAKIADFGLAYEEQNTNPTPPSGTIRFMSPRHFLHTFKLLDRTWEEVYQDEIFETALLLYEIYFPDQEKNMKWREYLTLQIQNMPFLKLKKKSSLKKIMNSTSESISKFIKEQSEFLKTCSPKEKEIGEAILDLIRCYMISPPEEERIETLDKALQILETQELET